MNRRLLSLALVLGAASASAEVSVTHPAGGGTQLYFEVSPTGPWGRVRADVVTSEILNVQGDARSDGWPSFAIRPNGLPTVAYGTAGDAADVWVAWHDGLAWRPAMNVSHRAGADSGPTVVHDEWNNRFVTWNNTRRDRLAVLFTGVKSDGTAQTGVVELSARQRDTRKPSIAAFGEDIYVAYEEQANGVDDVPYIGIDRVIPQRNPDRSIHCSGENTPDFSRSATIRTNLTERALMGETTVHVEAGTLWVTWIDNRTRVGWVELRGPGWFSEPAYRPYDSSLGPESALSAVRDQVLAP